MKPLPTDLQALAAGGKGALARVLSAIEARPEDPALAELLDAAAAAPRGTAIGLTGPPGVGKSTLTNSLIGRVRARGETVAVIAVDPTSKRSGGALLGDRTRIETDPEDPGIFVRSMAARRRLGGLADLTFPAAVLMRALYDWVIIETVGVGQSETEIADCADLVVFCAQPGSGDALQFMKAGVMEVPDIVLVTKGDMGAVARRAAADVRGALSLAVEEASPPDVAVVSSRTGEGLNEALDLIAGRMRECAARGDLASQRAGQARTWTESRIIDLFGRVGLELIRPRLANMPQPFATMARISDLARDEVQKMVNNI
jgi:LAO/AO transport system kinase